MTKDSTVSDARIRQEQQSVAFRACGASSGRLPYCGSEQPPFATKSLDDFEDEQNDYRDNPTEDDDE